MIGGRATFFLALTAPAFLAAACNPGAGAGGTADDDFDVVILDGRVIDPETGLDGARNVGIREGVIAAVTGRAIAGRDTVDASGRIVAPGFIDTHSQGQNEENDALQVLDGVTTGLFLALGTSDVEGWYAARRERARINHGVSIGHMRVRMVRMGEDLGPDHPSGAAAYQRASEAEIAQIRRGVEEGLAQGALGVGFGLQYTPAASRWEVIEAFRAAAAAGAPAFIHLRFMGDLEPESSVAALQEVIAASALTGVPIHIHHVHSSGLRATEQLLALIEEARERGLDVTAEVYPYDAGMTSIQSATFDGEWQAAYGIGYGELEWLATGERLTAESFRRYRAEGGPVILRFIPQEALEAGLRAPFVNVASAGKLQDGAGHPRSAGSYARLLGHYVRDEGLLTWPEAIRRASYLPAVMLQAHAPDFLKKGRVQEGAHADLVVIDPERVRDRATYLEPALASEGIVHTLVHGRFVVRDGRLVADAFPGRPVRAPVAGAASSASGPRSTGASGTGASGAPLPAAPALFHGPLARTGEHRSSDRTRHFLGG